MHKGSHADLGLARYRQSWNHPCDKGSTYRLNDTVRDTAMKTRGLIPLFLAFLPGLGHACDIDKTSFGKTAADETVDAYSLHTQTMRVTVLTLGGIIHDVAVPDRDGRMDNVIRNLNSLAAYEGRANFSSLVGRYANRISGGGFSLDGQRYDLSPGKPDAVISHGGPHSFGSRIWKAAPFKDGKTCGVELSLVSPDGDNGFPGEVRVTVRYTLSPDNSLMLDYTATTTKPTVIALTHHAYWNLSGADTVYDQSLAIDADSYLPTDSHRVPTGEIAPVTGTPLDLRQGARLGDVVAADHASIHAAKGLDHTFVLNGSGLKTAALLSDAASGRVLTISTTEPGIIAYTAGGFDGSLTGADGRPLAAGTGVALETQHFPDSPNKANFPSTLLRPGETLRSRTVYRFTTR